MEDSGKVVIRSFRLVFDRGYRRLFKIDRYRLPFAYGLPILGIVYAALVALALVVVDKLPDRRPGARGAAAADPLGRDPGRPVDGDAALATRRPEAARRRCGRGSRRRSRSASCRAGSPPSATATRLELGEIACAPDGREGRYRPGRVSGPAEVLLRYPARGWQRGRRLHVEQTSDQPLYVGTQITLRAGEQLVFEAPER